MSNDSASGGGRYREFVVLALVPGIVGALIVASWALAHWKVGPAFVNAGLALFATLFGGWQRFLGGFQDIYRRKITVNVFVAVALIATMAVGEFRPAAIIIFIMAVVGALESYTLDKNRQKHPQPAGPGTADGDGAKREGGDHHPGWAGAGGDGGDREAGGAGAGGWRGGGRREQREPGADHRRIHAGGKVQGERVVQRHVEFDGPRGSAGDEGGRGYDAGADRAPGGGSTGDQGARSRTWRTASRSGSCRSCWCWRLLSFL